jgi:hypothetical protein
MKKITVIAALLLVSVNLFAQDCSKCLFMQKGRVLTTTAYDGDTGKELRKSVQTVTDVTNVNGVMTSKVIDGGDGPQLALTFICDHGALKMEVNTGTAKSGDAEDIKTGYIEYPVDMKVGDHLKDVVTPVSMTIEKKTYTGTTTISGRIILAKETVTTTAGSWSCYKITYTVTSGFPMPIMGTKMPPISMGYTEWYAPNVGIIKSKITDGMLVELTNIK